MINDNKNAPIGRAARKALKNGGGKRNLKPLVDFDCVLIRGKTDNGIPFASACIATITNA
jgi:hypothetical protein